MSIFDATTRPYISNPPFEPEITKAFKDLQPGDEVKTLAGIRKIVGKAFQSQLSGFLSISCAHVDGTEIEFLSADPDYQVTLIGSATTDIVAKDVTVGMVLKTAQGNMVVFSKANALFPRYVSFYLTVPNPGADSGYVRCDIKVDDRVEVCKP
jgi:hypothetical protein